MKFSELFDNPVLTFFLGMPTGYFLINWAKSKITEYLEKTGETMGRNIAMGMKEGKVSTNGGYETDLLKLTKAIEDLSYRVAQLEGRYRNE